MRFEWLVPAYIGSLCNSCTFTWYDSHIGFKYGQKMFRGILNVALVCIPNKQASRKTQYSINFIKSCVCEIFVHPAIFTEGTNYPGILSSSLLYRFPLNTMNSGSLVPLVFADSTTVTLIFSWPVLLRGIDLLPTKSTVVSPGMSSHTGVSSMAMVWSNEYCFFSLRLRTYRK